MPQVKVKKADSDSSAENDGFSVNVFRTLAAGLREN